MASLATDPARVRLVVGLGNPGATYADTRHNVGFQCVDALADQLRAEWLDARSATECLLALAANGDSDLLLAKPVTYMNHSGRAVKRLLAVARIAPAQVLVVYDDMDLPLGTLRIRERGSAGTHNGMRSIVADLGTEQFPRLRIGIGQAAARGARDYVLSPFTSAEQGMVAAAVARAVEAALVWATTGPGAAMNRFNVTVDVNSLVP